MKNTRLAEKNRYSEASGNTIPIAGGHAASARVLLSVTPDEKELMDIIRMHGVVTKAELVSNTHHSRTKINNSISSLLKKQYILKAGAGDYTGGRRSVKFIMNGDLGLVAGVDIGATSIDIVLADLSGKVLARTGEPGNVREGPQFILERVCVLIEQMIRESGEQADRLCSIGIGVPGPVDFKRGTLVSPPIMPGWDRFPIIPTIQSHFPSANVVVDNDVNVMAIGEKFWGAGKDFENLIFIKIGTGIGAGIVCRGEIYRGTNGCAGDIGHICVSKSGPICLCGNAGCLEAMAAGPAIAEQGRSAALEGKSQILLKLYETNGGRLRAEDVNRAAIEGDPVAIEIIRGSGQMIGDVLAGLVNFFNPGLIVIGGGVSNIGNILLSSIRQTILKRSLPLATRDLRVVFSATGQGAGITGAMALAIDKGFFIEGVTA